MENYIVSARKYRPATFRSVVGQEALTTTLKNAIAAKKLAQAYLFCGPRGVGKTTCARIFAKTINCLTPTKDHEACNECESCVAFNEQRSYNIMEMDAASNNSVDDIRTLIDQVRIPPQIGKYKVYIIDEVHMLSTSAFNSFLKTLEEPPAHAVFVLATTEKHKVIPTILSRCQVYDFNRINIDDIVNQLSYIAQEEGVIAEAEALNVIAQKADGGMRDALSIFDQSVSYTRGNLTYKTVIENLNVLDYDYYFKLTDAILTGNVVDCLLVFNDILNGGFEGQYVIGGLADHFRNLMVCKDAKTAKLFQVGEVIRQRYVDTAVNISNELLYKALEISNECDLNYRISKNKRLLVELTLIRLCQLNESPDPEKKTTVENAKPQIKSVQPQVNNVQPQEKNVQSTEVKQPKQETSSKVTLTTSSSAKPQEKKASNDESNNSKNESAPVVKKTMVSPSLGISLASIKIKNEVSTSEVQESSSEEIDTEGLDYSETDLIIAWKAFADKLIEEKLLKNTMILYQPKKLNNIEFEVEVNTEINKQYLNENSLAILTWLRDSLKNQSLKMLIKISETNLISRPLTQRDIFDKMVEENPSLQKLSDEFGLELD
ncbi:MAG: DNA polymerase III subunit gamma/tau [Dysgonamonadaceae bacterium]|jgi:DNA polymerase-3 subunit gamma/tau|nr:DNA polymerase III subunit gamma/tau [Dysgonamonadaceae bacterium]MDD3309530.1 DNA polymerase III subunit gamma/tau [Dysgonamonadaceae bacterium]MDD3899839.1 DNA polymerase III subunit gamma/tau [Dysgonamonadaceae bacterium]MDD4398537.1 DNA polymerase III subunit gamma/tau [Dysgonamonadaceae bacterium]